MATESVTSNRMSAVILAMPAKVQRKAKQRMNRVEMDARHTWMMDNREKWETVATDGATYSEPMVERLVKEMRKKWPGEYPEPTMERMRRDIAEGRKRIQKRNAAKAWLASLGVDLDNIKDAEQALFAAFDKLNATK